MTLAVIYKDQTIAMPFFDKPELMLSTIQSSFQIKTPIVGFYDANLGVTYPTSTLKFKDLFQEKTYHLITAPESTRITHAGEIPDFKQIFRQFDLWELIELFGSFEFISQIEFTSITDQLDDTIAQALWSLFLMIDVKFHGVTSLHLLTSFIIICPYSRLEVKMETLFDSYDINSDGMLESEDFEYMFSNYFKICQMLMMIDEDRNVEDLVNALTHTLFSKCEKLTYADFFNFMSQSPVKTIPPSSAPEKKTIRWAKPIQTGCPETLPESRGGRPQSRRGVPHPICLDLNKD